MRRARPLACIILVLIVLALGGCSSSSSTKAVAYIRTVDAISDGGTANIYINQGTANGSLTYFHTSPYLFIGGGEASFLFGLSAVPNHAYSAPKGVIAVGDIYSVVIMGRADVSSTADTRYPRLVVYQDHTAGAIPAGHAALRLINTAPDSVGADFYVNSGSGYTLESTDVAYAANGSYVIEPAGTISVEIDQTGTNTVQGGPQSFTLVAGKQYSIYFVEPDVAAPTYGVQMLSDSP